MSDAQDRSEHARSAANARWTGQVATRAADTIVERAADLGGEPEEVMQAVSRVLPGWLPARSARLIAEEDRVQRMHDRAAERQRAENAEQAHDRALASWRAQAELNGEAVSVMDMVSGNVGVTAAEVLMRARDADDARDRVAEQYRPGGRKADEVMFQGAFDAPEVPATRSAIGRELFNRTRRFKDRIEARRRADDLDNAHGVSRRSQPPVKRDDEAARLRYEAACREIGQEPGQPRTGGDDVRIRMTGGEITEIF